MAHDVFICYASEDKSAADAARAALEARGVICWIAPRDILPGEDETESILRAIDTSSVVVLCLSASANASKLVTQQVARGFNRNIPIVPLRIEDVEPSHALKLFLGSQEGVDAYVPPLDSHFAALIALVDSLLAATVAPVVGATPSPEPPYKEVTLPVRERRTSAPPPHAGRNVLVIAALVALAFVVIAVLFILLPQSQVQPLAVSSKTPEQSPSPSPTSSPTASSTPTPSAIFSPTPTPSTLISTTPTRISHTPTRISPTPTPRRPTPTP